MAPSDRFDTHLSSEKGIKKSSGIRANSKIFLSSLEAGFPSPTPLSPLFRIEICQFTRRRRSFLNWKCSYQAGWFRQFRT